MTHQVDVNGVIHEFPDEATPEMMQEALKHESNQQRIDAYTGILERPAKRLGEDAWSLLKDIGNTAGQGIPSALNQLFNDPKSLGKNVAAGASGILPNIYNSVLKTPSYLAHLGSDQLSNMIKKYTPQIPTEDVENFFGGKPKNQEDVDVRRLTGLAPIGLPIAKAGIKGVVNTGKGIVNTGIDAFRNVKPLEEALEKSGKEVESATQEAAPVKPGMINEPKNELEHIENEIGKHINAEGSHDVNASTAFVKRADSIEDYWSDAYKKFMTKIEDSKFHMPEKAMDNIGYDMDAIVKRVQAGANPRTVVKEMEKEALANQNPFYKNLISKAPTAKDTNAADFLAKHKDFRDALGGLKKDLNSDRYGSMEKQTIREAINKAKEVEKQIKKTLEEGLGEFKPEYDWLNKGFSEQIYPLRDNPVVEAARNGKLSDNIIKSIRTNEPGMPLVREIVKNDPELLRNVVGQRYMAKPSEIHSPNELMREYLDEMPEFKKLLKTKENILKKSSERKDISLKEKMRIEKELKDMKDKKSSARTKLKYVGGAALGYMGLSEAKKFFHL